MSSEFASSFEQVTSGSGDLDEYFDFNAFYDTDGIPNSESPGHDSGASGLARAVDDPDETLQVGCNDTVADLPSLMVPSQPEALQLVASADQSAT